MNSILSIDATYFFYITKNTKTNNDWPSSESSEYSVLDFVLSS